MKPFARSSEDKVQQSAAEWVLRHDRGLTAAEQDAFSQWLAADKRHRDAWAEHRWGWEEMDRLIGIQTTVHAWPDPDLLAPRRPALWSGWLTAGIAAALALGVFLFNRPTSEGESQRVEVTPLSLIEQRALEDGSQVSLNRGAEIAVEFTSTERRVRLVRGEANFQVSKNPARPFVVSAGGVDVRAVGTAFNVRLGRVAVEVLVTEGRVEVAPPAGVSAESPRPLVPVLGAGQRAVVPLAPGAVSPSVVTLSSSEMETRLAWQPRLLDFTDAPLGDIVTEFNRRNTVRLTLADAALVDLRLSASFRSDNVEGFVRLMESDFNMRVERRGGEIVLHRRD